MNIQNSLFMKLEWNAQHENLTQRQFNEINYYSSNFDYLTKLTGC